MNLKRAILLTVILLPIALLFVQPVAAIVSINTSAVYRGGEEGQSQAVEVTYSLSPEENKITDARIQVEETDTAFVDFDSFERTVNPGSADVEINTVEEGIFEIEELERGQEVTLRFEAYPRTTKQEELEVAVLNLEYVQQGQTLENTTRITADLSDSPWFQLQDAEEGSNGGGGGGIGLVLGILVGLLFGIGATYYAIEIY